MIKKNDMRFLSSENLMNFTYLLHTVFLTNFVLYLQRALVGPRYGKGAMYRLLHISAAGDTGYIGS